MKKRLLAVVMGCVMVIGLAGCGGGTSTGTETETSADTETAADAETSGDPIKVALVYSGFLGDKSFNDLAHDGAMRAKEDFGMVLPGAWLYGNPAL